MKLHYILLNIFFCIRFLPVLSQTHEYQFSKIDIYQGLSHNQINAIYRDAKGFMWFGTLSGLNRYDGYNFRVFKHNIKDSLSLSDDFISRILEGPDDKLWIETGNGFNIYDPLTETVNRNAGRFLLQIGLPDTIVTDIVKDSKGNFWFLNPKGLFLYDPKTKKTVAFKHDPTDHFSIGQGAVSRFAEDRKGNFWIVFRNGKIEMMEAISKKIFLRTDAIGRIFAGIPTSYTIFIDNDNDLWISAINASRGVVWYNTASGSATHFNKESGTLRLDNNTVTGVVQDNKGLMWIATDHGGINILDKKLFSIQYVVNSEFDARSLSQNSITTLYKDKGNIIWAGTFKKGINFYHENNSKFPLYRHRLSEPGGLSYDDVNKFVEDAHGNLWIGTNGGGLICFNRKANKFSRMRHDPSNNNSLSNDVIIGLCIDHDNKLWIGTYYGGLDCYDGKRFIHYRHNEADSSSLSDDKVWDIFEDSKQTLWIGTSGGGVNIFDRKTAKFTRYRSDGNNPVRSDYITDFMEDKGGNIWIATAFGIDVLQKKTGMLIRYANENGNNCKLSSNNINSLFQDSRGLIWIATRDGLNVFDTGRKTFQTFRTEQGLPDNTVQNVLEDKDHNLWLSTPNGLSYLFVHQERGTGKIVVKCKNYDESDGLQGREFNVNSAYYTSRGEMIFGGAGGFNLFDPARIKPDKTDPVIVLTDFHLFNRPLNTGEEVNGRIILKEALPQTGIINLRYNENIISLEFSALNFINPERIRYSYYLENFDKEWIVTDGKQRRATYTNLDPGTYLFSVKSSDGFGGWNAAGATLKIVIAPPFWKTIWAYIFYTATGIILLILARHFILLRAKRKFELDQERTEARRMHELDLMKIRFFTNVSHEFRTPLSLILSPLNSIIEETNEPAKRSQFLMMQRNARRLLNLVSQLLDFRKMEVRELKLHPVPGDLVKFIREVSFAFTDLAEKKNIGFIFNAFTDSLFVAFDQEKIERIMFNLLSNAFKFTPEKGEIMVTVGYNAASENNGSVEIVVSDNGIGIDKSKHHKIFEAFFQDNIPESIMNQGSGIGLAITREFVKLHGGTVTVESEPGRGSRFHISLPVTLIEPSGEEAVRNTDVETFIEGESDAGIPVNVLSPVIRTDIRKKTVLVVEDNDDFRFYLKEILGELYNVIEAVNGKEGWQKALSQHPDLVLSDISMPEMNGIDLCKKIKSDERTRQMPVIMLTAITGEEHLLKGLETGANDYMTKPFSVDVLLSRIRNILSQQETLKKTFKKQVEVVPAEIEVVSSSEKFITQAVRITELKMNDTKFSVEDLSAELFISRVVLYRKLLTLTGKTPIEFIRSLRMKKAAQLLEKSAMNISEIAYEVGYNNPKQFTKYFKEEYGVTPSAYVAGKKIDIS